MPKSPAAWVGTEAPSGVNVAAISATKAHTIPARLKPSPIVEDEPVCVGRFINGDCWTGAKVVFTGHSGIDTATGDGRSRGNGWGPYEHDLPPILWSTCYESISQQFFLA